MDSSDIVPAEIKLHVYKKCWQQRETLSKCAGKKGLYYSCPEDTKNLFECVKQTFLVDFNDASKEIEQNFINFLQQEFDSKDDELITLSKKNPGVSTMYDCFAHADLAKLCQKNSLLLVDKEMQITCIKAIRKYTTCSLISKRQDSAADVVDKCFDEEFKKGTHYEIDAMLEKITKCQRLWTNFVKNTHKWDEEEE